MTPGRRFELIEAVVPNAAKERVELFVSAWNPIEQPLLALLWGIYCQGVADGVRAKEKEINKAKHE